MSYDVHSAKVGDRIILEEPGRDAIEMTVWAIEPPGTAGRSRASGPLVYAHIRPGGFGITVDGDSCYQPHVRAA